ncbi:Lrp/AsnC family transcriptional regulator [Photobacterium alginatilyticum]|uniref:Lrp/AsnC family transcriptional regulator n=1 Tax=Photobacterium alginatilyticum TaxID=1775171 RepID=A0ABW9YBR6_9GAMM|nr:Lrp/AsnC family transcriptional regulator [Photobacterium alginatilyticum]NBI51210.1 Lrp/AsnC family transcriptional regulator [Photobacterium alginatilyticum]
MDNFDRLILVNLQSNNKVTSEELGHEIGLSATAVQRRVKKLRETGIIDKEIAVLNSNQLGGFVTVIVDVVMVKGGTQIIDGFKEKAIKNPDVQQCYYVAGDKDFVLVITATNMQRYEEITRELFLDDANILKFTSNIAMQPVKVGLSIPI